MVRHWREKNGARASIPHLRTVHQAKGPSKTLAKRLCRDIFILGLVLAPQDALSIREDHEIDTS